LEIRNRQKLRQRLRLRIDVGRARSGREPEDRLRNLQEVRIGEDAVFIGNRWRDTLEVEGELNADVLSALIALELVLDEVRSRRLTALVEETDDAPWPTKSNAAAKAFQRESLNVLPRLFGLETPPSSTLVMSALALIWSPSP
jgi:hypothetical protein